jgi:hypothetical protein
MRPHVHAANVPETAKDLWIGIETTINGVSPDERRRHRQVQEIAIENIEILRIKSVFNPSQSRLVDLFRCGG